MNTSSLLTRRNFLRTTALAALAPAGCTSLQGTHGNFVDAHVHVWTPDTRRYPISPDPAFKKHRTVESFTPEQLFVHSRPQGVSRVVLIQMSFYTTDNSYMLDCIARRPGTFRGVAIVDETKPDVCATMKSLAKRGVRGFRIYTDRAKAEAWQHSEGMKKMWACGADEGLAMCLLADPESLPAVRRMCRAFPRTRVVIDHFARISMKGPVRQHELDNLCRLADSAHTHVKTSAFYALGKKKAPYTDMAPLVRRLRDTFGAQRLMWASDCPYQVQEGHTYADSIAVIRDRLGFLSADDKQWMLRKTAEKVFFS
jgi:predicted TIM-barrel fold metal-dependent hydrolase